MTIGYRAYMGKELFNGVSPNNSWMSLNHESTVPVNDCDQQVMQLHGLHFCDENNDNTETYTYGAWKSQ